MRSWCWPSRPGGGSWTSCEGASAASATLSARSELSQPAVSKHLRVLREGGFVACRIAAQQRIYSIDPGPLRALDGWLQPYRRLWTRHLDALERHLDPR